MKILWTICDEKMEINENLRKMLYSKISEIGNLEIRKFVKEALDYAPKDFWITPCSGSGKYHPPENQGNGGLIRHLIKCIETAKDLCRYFGVNSEQKDIILAAVFLHDIKKNGDPWGESTDMEHGKIGAEFLDSFGLREPYKTKIKNCVRYHLYRFTGTREDIERASNPTEEEKILQLTDLFCARKYASWLPGFEVPQEVIDNFSDKFQASLDLY